MCSQRTQGGNLHKMSKLFSENKKTKKTNKKNQKNITNLLSGEFAYRVLRVNIKALRKL